MESECNVCLSKFKEFELQNPRFCCTVKLCKDCYKSTSRCPQCRDETVHVLGVGTYGYPNSCNKVMHIVFIDDNEIWAVDDRGNLTQIPSGYRKYIINGKIGVCNCQVHNII